MQTAQQLISRRVVVGKPEDRLEDVAQGIRAVNAHHCVVVDEVREFRGLIRLGDVACRTHAGNRILLDLISPVQPLVVGANEPASSVAELLRKHQLYEAVVVSDCNEYVGLVTAESVVEFLLVETTRQDVALQQTETKLRSATHAQETFLMSVSHELRTPLTPILILASEGADDKNLPADVREQFSIIATQALIEAQLIDALLHLGGMLKSANRLELKLTDLGSVLSRAIEEVRTRLGGRGPEIQAELETEVALVMGDVTRLDQALRNVIWTASRSCELGGRIRITSRSDRAGGKATITVVDDGRGMTNAEVALAFQPFPREARPAETTGTSKISPGLTLANAIVKLHSGSMEVESKGLGTGTTVTVTLPTASPSELRI